MNVRVRSILACGLVAIAASSVAAQDTTRVLRKPTAAEDLQLFSQVLNQIRVNHPDSIDTHVLFMAAIEAMLRAADPHSYVIPAARLVPEKEAAFRQGKLIPVPVVFTFVGDMPQVASVAAGSRASKQDILPGDELILIDDRPVIAASEAELELTLAGAKNSTVKLTLSRRRIDGSRVTLHRAVVREKVDDASAIAAALLMDAGTGYVRVTTFAGERIAKDLHDAISRLEQQGMKQLIIDLRDNGGGRVDEAESAAATFLPTGAVVYTSDGIKNEKPQTVVVKRAFWKDAKDYPVIVLINRGTASASEIFAAALQDHDRALVVGEPSFGKALLMRYMPLADGSLLALVIGHVKTPCGRVLQRQYRNVRVADYYRLAGSMPDTTGRPKCKSQGGRTLYGGGGVFPDVVLKTNDATPLWFSRAEEKELLLKWSAAYLSENQR